MPNFFNHLKIFNVFILFKSISAQRFFGITLSILFFIPPPVILAQPFNKLLLTRFNISVTYILVGLINSFFKKIFFFKFIFFFLLNVLPKNIHLNVNH